MMKKLAVVAFLLCGVVGSVHAEGDAKAGEKKSQVCAACHGADGNSTNAMWPRLAGQNAQYTVKQLKDFKTGSTEDNGRVDASMAGMVANLSEQDMQDLAAFYAKQTVQHEAVPAQYIEMGEALYRGGDAERGVTACIACHGPRGEGMGLAKFPAISGQHVDYTIKQLKAFREGERHNDTNAMMRNIAARMSNTQIEAIAYYLAGLH
jgi:cytochrome c553